MIALASESNKKNEQKESGEFGQKEMPIGDQA